MSTSGNQPWYSNGVKFECTCCGNCCTGPEGAVWFTEEEGKEIAEHLGMRHEMFLAHHSREIEGHRSLNEFETEHGFDCEFLDRETKPGKAYCSIYEVRPLQCRTWPFWPEVAKSKAAWERTRKTTPCPGMNSGTLIPVEEIVGRLKKHREGGQTPW